MKKSHKILKICSSVLLVGLIGSETAQAEEMPAWYYHSWRQWHPQIGSRTLGNVGTQFYFPKEDYVPKDSDGDGVYDEHDRCPGTPPGVKVDKNGCPPHVAETINPDMDGDHVLNESDECPTTPKGADVDVRGCWRIGNILFPYDKSLVRDSYKADLEKVSTVMRRNPGVNMELDGHTDSDGSNAYNQKLSERRNQSVRAHLLNTGVSDGQINTRAFGETQPAADNSSSDGRARNRRTELIPSVR
ncbi:MAG: OmpA family protein [Magnetococcales bacterium]|nr:OmpA family protein [Magnetococcales bacterium]MBF0148953.1 OmpA family protein [Magnetococcales bacterium]MBF0173828.1 OmpA family protein [Magnetococcales bacterium]MBF0347862.1 OmpA family protein [Magnetococcales bacterium]MBF0631177.1 OmpA family protein [Magnetococcales bacterium]